ncbi:hypothetical protein LCGC14_3053600, partial [marine sediment metagenome]
VLLLSFTQPIKSECPAGDVAGTHQETDGIHDGGTQSGAGASLERSVRKGSIVFGAPPFKLSLVGSSRVLEVNNTVDFFPRGISETAKC